MVNGLWHGLTHAAVMAWETFWALVLGFGVSAALQVFVSKEKMGRLFGRTTWGTMALATGFGAASSSCSYAAAAAARSAFKQGAALIPALAFMFASTNLVIELGAVLWLLMGWRFVLAEAVGSFVLIGLLWGFARLFFPRDLEEQARRQVEGEEEDGCCHHSGHDHGEMHGATADGSPGPWQRMADAFVMDWQMLWKEIAGGFLIAGFLAALVPDGWWKALFLNGGSGWLRLVENAAVGPLIAVVSFVCSVGNIPLASLLWGDGISFGGVISFLYADLIIIPLVLIYRKYYGDRPAAFLTLVFLLAMIGSGIVVDVIFSVLGLIPTGPRPPSALIAEHFQWNYTTYLDLVALVLGGALVTVHFRRRPSLRPGGELPAHSAHGEHHPVTESGPAR